MADNNIIIRITSENNLDELQKDLQSTVNMAMKLEEEYEELTGQMDETALQLGKNSREYKNLAAKAEQNRKSIAALTKGIKLSDMSMNALRQRSAMLRNMLDKLSKSANPKEFAKLQRQLEDTEDAMQRLNQESDRAKVKGTIKMKTLAAAAAAYYTLKKAIRNAANTIMELDKAAAVLASVSGKSQKEIKALVDEAKRLGAATSYTAQEMIELETEMAKLGFTETEILQSVDAVQRFATATGADLAGAASLAGATLRAFGLEATQMERVVSAMAVSTTKSALDFGALDTAMSTIAPVAKSLGFTIEDTTALLGVLANSGFDASTAATATRNILLNLSDANGKLARTLGEPVKSLDDLVPALQKLRERGIDLSEALELTDKRSVAAFNTFLSGTNTLKELRDSITGVSEELKQMEATRLDSVAGSVDLLSSAWDGLVLSFENSKGAMKAVLNGLTSILDAINKYIEDGGFATTFAKIFGADDIKAEIKYKEWFKENTEAYKSGIDEFQKMTLEEARERNTKLTAMEEENEKRLENELQAAFKNEDYERQAFYRAQLDASRDYRQKRNDILKQMEDDALRQQEEAIKQEEANRLAQRKAAIEQAKKDREILLQEKKNQLQGSQQSASRTSANYTNEVKLSKEIAKLEAEIQIDGLNRQELGVRAYAAQVKAIHLELKQKLKEIDDDVVSTAEENAKKRTEIEVQVAEAAKNAITGAEGIDEQKEVINAYYETLRRQIEENANIEKAEVERSTKTEEEKAAEIKRINNKMYADLQANKKQNATDLIEVDSQYLAELERKAQEASAVAENTQGVGKLDALQDKLNAQLDVYDEQQKQLDSKWAAGLITYADYKQQEFEITKDIADAEAEYQSSKLQVVTDSFQTALDYMQQISDLAFEAIGNNVQAELDALDEMYTTDAEEAAKSTTKKYLSEEEYEKKKAALEEKQAKYAKAQALVSAGIAAAQAIIMSLAQAPVAYGPFPNPAGIASLALATAMGAAQIAVIAAKPLAQYAKGRKGGKGEYALVGEKGPEVMYVPKGASIVPNNKLSTPDAWETYGVPQLPIPAIANISTDALDNAITATTWQPIDYDKLGSAVAKAMPKQRPVSVNIDRSGISVQNGNNKRTYLNTKYQGVWS